MKFFTEIFYDTEHGIIEFHFERVGNPSTTGYHIAVSAGTAKPFDFIMKKKEGRWKLANATELPDWIQAMEEVLSDSISAHFLRVTS